MPAELLFLLTVSWPETLLNLLAAVIFLGEDIPANWRKWLSAGLLIGICFWALFRTVVDVSATIYILLALASAAIVLNGFFPGDFWRLARILTAFTAFLNFSHLLTYGLLPIFSDATPRLAIEIPEIAVRVWWPAFVISLLASYPARRFRPAFLGFFSLLEGRHESPGARRMFLAFVLQIALILGLFNDLLNYTQIYAHPGQTAALIATFLILLGSSIYTLVAAITSTEKSTYDLAQKTISDNFMSLINSVRAQRHDFVNHIQVLSELAHQQDIHQIREYLSQLISITHQQSELLITEDPFISSLINAKINQAALQGIELKTEISTALPRVPLKALDVVRILGNLIDNALEKVALQAFNGADRWVKLTIAENGPFYTLTVTNPGKIPAEIQARLFTPDFSTKPGHSGIGLYNSRHLAELLHGKLDYLPGSDNLTRFRLVLPKL